MAIPQDRLSTTTLEADFLEPDDRDRETSLIDYERGGLALGDTSLGIDYQIWVAEVAEDRGSISVYPEDTPGMSTVVVTDAGISDVSLAFDQNMNVTVAYVSNKPKLYWFDTSIQSYTTTEFDDHISQYVTMDDKRDAATGQAYNDVLFFYIKGSALYYRQQRDRYTVQYTIKTPRPGDYIIRSGMMDNLRVGVQFGSRFGLQEPE